MKYLFLLPILVVLGCAQYNKPEIKNESDLLKRVVESLGGYDSIKAIETQQMYGHYIEPGYKLLIPAKVEKKRPIFRVIGDPKTIGFAEGFDGASWEFFNGKSKRTLGEAEAATRRGAEFDFPFIDWKEKGHTVKFEGAKMIEDRYYYQLMITLNDGWVLHYYFDKDTFLPSYYRKAMPLHAVGEDIEYLVSLSDYRIVNGVKVPFSVIERNIKTGAMVNATIYDSVLVNKPIEVTKFSPPN